MAPLPMKIEITDPVHLTVRKSGAGWCAFATVYARSIDGDEDTKAHDVDAYGPTPSQALHLLAEEIRKVEHPPSRFESVPGVPDEAWGV